MTPTVSIIVPNYNHEKYLSKRLDSIFNQTFQDFEVILLDDASTDSSVEILKEYSYYQKVSHFIINETNSGSTFKQWQKGIELAIGQFIWIAESDDWADEQFLEILLRKKEGIDVFVSKSFILEIGKEPYISPNHIKDNLLLLGDDFIKQYLMCGNTLFNASAVIFRKNKINKNIFDIIQNYKYAGDWIFWIEILLDNTIHYSIHPLNYFNRQTSLVSSTSYIKGHFFTEGAGVISFIKSKDTLVDYKNLTKMWSCWIYHYHHQYLIDKNTFSKLRFEILKKVFIKNFDFYLLIALLNVSLKKIFNVAKRYFNNSLLL